MEGLVGYGVFGDDKGSEVCDVFLCRVLRVTSRI